MQEPKTKRRWLILVAVWLGFSFLFSGLLTSPTIQFRLFSLSSLMAVTDLRLRDSLVGTLPPLPGDSDIVFLGIDESSLTVGEDDPAVIDQSRALTLMTDPFPWSREVWGLAIERLLESGAKLVVLDLLINSPRDGDEVLRDVIAKYPGRVVLASSLSPPASSQGGGGLGRYLEPSESLIPEGIDPATLPVGFVNFFPELDGQVRAIRFQETVEAVANIPDHPSSPAYPSIAAAILKAAEEEYPVLDRRGSHMMQMVSNLSAVYSPKPLYEIFWPSTWRQNFGNGEAFKGKIVMIGPAAAGLQDRHPTPAGTVMGPQLHLNAITAVRNGALFKTVSSRLDVVLIFLLGFCALLAVGLFRRPLYTIGVLVLLYAGFLIAARIALVSGHSLGLLGPLLSLVAVGGVGVICDYSQVFRERLLLRRALERRVSADVLHEILENPESYLNQLGGVRRSVAILFSDLRGFTKMSEKALPEEMVAQLNAYFDVMVDQIQGNRGMVDKFIGDAIMAVWGSVPSQAPDESARQAVQAALRMTQEMERLNQEWSEQAKKEEATPIQWAMGIGLHCGDAITGNIGSEKRLELTVIGDAVNLASRLEGVTKRYQVPVIVSEAIADYIAKEPGWVLRPLDRVRVVGRSAPVTLYEPLSSPETAKEAGTNPLVAAAPEFQRAFEAYQDQDFKTALERYRELQTRFPEDLSTSLLARRSQEFIDSPPGDDWDGGIALDSK